MIENFYMVVPMKRVGIITINDNKNYGNRLQSYAMQNYLKQFNLKGENIIYTDFCDNHFVEDTRPLSLKLKVAIAETGFVKNLRNSLNRHEITEAELTRQKLIKERVAAFGVFNESYISAAQATIKGSQVPSGLDKEYDYFVAGSDQIWNRTFGYGTKISYLQFAPKKKRIAISASFGVDEMPERFKNQARHYLDGMHFISVREETGRQIVRELTGNDCEVFLDPTMLVSPDVYSPLLESAKAVLPENYVLCFFLGELSDKRKGFIERFAAEKGCQTVYLNSPDNPEQFVCDPCDFLKAIKNCRYLFTDSFHGCVFSILFQRQLFAMEREGKTVKMSGRIRTLFDKFGLTDRLVCEDDTLPEPISETRFEKIFAILENERKRTTDILSQILK